MQKPQWITIAVALVITAAIYLFGISKPPRTVSTPAPEASAGIDEHGHEINPVNIDTILFLAKKRLNAEQVARLNTLENSISNGAEPAQQVPVYRQLAAFWSDSARIFEPYAWYMAQAARLENSEKSLTFAARLFLENLQIDEVERRRVWKALQAKDLFERSLKINPDNDSAQVGLGACYLFGNISASPMEGILKVRTVAEKDSNNLYAQMTLAKGSVLSGQYDKAIPRLQSVMQKDAGNAEAALMLADLYERTGDKKNAVTWYRKSLPLVNDDLRKVLDERIRQLSGK